jgi:membrane-bound ClpP family serine protease
MSISQAYLAVALFILVAIAGMMFLTRKSRQEARLSALAGIAFVLLLAGLFSSENRLLGYALISAGVILAVVDTFRRLSKR